MKGSSRTPTRIANGAFSLARRLAGHAETRPDAVAIHFASDAEPRTVTWRELWARVAAVTARLASDPPPSGTAMVLAENRIETRIALLGALCGGVDVLPVSPDSPAAEWTELARRCDATLLVETRSASAGASAWTGPRLAVDEIIAGAGEATDGPVASGEVDRTGSLLLHSSGTQGTTKIVRRPPGALEVLARNVVLGVGLDEEDVVLITLPLCHSYAIDFALLGSTWAGARVVLHERFVPGRAAAALVKDGITVWPAVPLMLDAVSRNAPERSAALDACRVISAGSPLPPRVRIRFEAVYGARVAQLYGASEYGAIAYSPPDAAGFDPASVGRPFEGVELRVVTPGQSDARNPLPAGEEGEVWVKSPTAMDGYLDAPDRPDPEGFWTSGDLGRLDRHGALFVTGRVKALIDVGGRKVNPLEVESVLARHPDVAEAVVVGIGFSDTVTRLKAIVVPGPDRRPSVVELREFARSHLAPYKVPRAFELRDEVPRSTAGKVLRQQLAEEGREAVRHGPS